MEKLEQERLEEYLSRFRQQSSLGAPGALEQFRLIREVKRNLPLLYEQFCTRLGLTPRQKEQSREIAYNLSILAEYEKFEQQVILFVVSCLTDEEFDNVVVSVIGMENN